MTAQMVVVKVPVPGSEPPLMSRRRPHLFRHTDEVMVLVVSSHGCVSDVWSSGAVVQTLLCFSSEIEPPKLVLQLVSASALNCLSQGLFGAFLPSGNESGGGKKSCWQTQASQHKS